LCPKITPCKHIDGVMLKPLVFSPSNYGQVVTLLTCVRHGTSVGISAMQTDVYRGFPQVIQTNPGIVLQTME
jgi:TRAP-type C4-dicarboxylate transport system substrate-binding protein